MKSSDIPQRNKERAKEMLLEQFGGEFPLYFINGHGEWFYTHVLSMALTQEERGEITGEELIRAKQMIFGQMLVSQGTQQQLFDFKFRDEKEYDLVTQRGTMQ